MEGLGSLLFYALLFYLLMRFGCGAHMIHGHGGHDSHGGGGGGGKFVDPVCGHDVEEDQGYGMMHEGRLYRFCSRTCLDQFEGEPALFIHKTNKQEAHHAQ